MIRRVVADGGTQIQVDEYGRVTANGSLLSEPYLQPEETGGIKPYAGVVPKGELFLLGDNRRDAADSRSINVGTIPKEQINGRVVMCLWPLKNLAFFLK